MRGLRIAPDLVLVDGRDTIDVGGIAVVAETAAASAWLRRQPGKGDQDELMTEMDRLTRVTDSPSTAYPTPQHLRR